MDRQNDLIANILATAHLGERSEWTNFLDGLHCAIDIPIDGRTDANGESFKRGMELGNALMKLVPPEDVV